MIGFAKEKAESQHINNISFYQSGFLNYEHSGNSLDAIVSNLALHHLPDFWKMVALKRVYNMLNDGGIFILGDVVFSFPVEDYHEKINNLVNTLKNHVDEDFARESEIHVKEEYSTFDWIIEGMLSRAGFEYEICKKDDYFALYCCMKSKL
jgi:ubiquinone/menaquinone biosynthesis C-methylase UbiE